jgi:tetratricopeptide (TPR) repeat protein
LGETQKAIKYYLRAIELREIQKLPPKSETQYNLGNAYCVLKQLDSAIAAYKKAVELDHLNAPALYNLGNAYYMKQDYEKSINAYLLALKLNPDSAECHFNIASAFRDNK